MKTTKVKTVLADKTTNYEIKKISNNLYIMNDHLFSYRTNVALIKENKIFVNGYYSVTTTKHINKVAKLFNLEIIKNY